MSDAPATDERSSIPVRTAGLAAGLGAWILWSAIILTGSGPIIINNVIAGAAIGAFAAYTAGWPDGGALPSIAAPLIVVLLGLWVIAAPFVLEVPADRLFWSNVISGLLVVALAGGSVYGSWQLTRSTATGV
ncbi:SPW repeat domain-containing protein [Natronorubrum halophilum]|uniref:SPW repeat domain-containing protein n=1 Tax=Natronorubrum halophilum TaxID=1702106 RepID=UPI000EF718CA|nr:SPW repeat protein [Natronorubrum halophilum]